MFNNENEAILKMQCVKNYEELACIDNIQQCRNKIGDTFVEQSASKFKQRKISEQVDDEDNMLRHKQQGSNNICKWITILWGARVLKSLSYLCLLHLQYSI